MKSLTRLMILACAMAASLCALNLKVEKINPETGEVKLLLPMHSTRIQAKVFPEGESIRLKPNQFYQGNVVTRPLKHALRSLLRVKVPHQKPARFLIQKISFIVR